MAPSKAIAAIASGQSLFSRFRRQELISAITAPATGPPMNAET